MKYDIRKIKQDLEDMNASPALLKEVSDIAGLDGKGRDITFGLRSLTADLVETVSDAESTPLNPSATKALDASKCVLAYLQMVLYS